MSKEQVGNVGEQVITHAHDDNMLGAISSYMIFIDVDECQTDNGGCNQTCTNTQGSYVCSCIGQYTLDDDQHGCIGIVHDNNYIQEFGFFLSFMMISLEPVQIAVTFVGNETFSIKWSIPTQNHSLISVPQGVTLNCTSTNQNVILNTNITHTATTVRLDLNKMVMCCVSAPNTKTKCVYTPDVNEPGM